ncbi:MAG TPA: NAD-dependent protein deacylase [Flavobacteriales bacterium]|mgnify:CR=1 FL=1|nr:NAD-dependent protein deacylase [Flavobacteriales bacterium]|tara:strand:+ start:95133 stop:95828 length:696 start_codon:yes stop_codon:yes gene_type:complete
MKKKKKIVVLSGAGISAESGLSTFRDNNGLWENYNVYEVATPEAWHNNPQMVLDFYKKRYEQVVYAQPNAAHYALANLEKDFDIQIITQNIDDLHERAGSSNVLHLHGKITKARSSVNPNIIIDVEKENYIKIGDKCPLGSQLRPHVVWFGEAVPEMTNAAKIASDADIFLVVGTSLNVYPAAGLLDFAPDSAQIILIDPNEIASPVNRSYIHIKEKATTGVAKFIEMLKN